MASETSEAVFVVAGSPPTKQEIRPTSPFESRVKWVESPTDEALQALYSESLSLLYVSEYEGFGMPLLEAMSKGCIPIAGNHSSVPEVLGDAGLIVNTNSVSEVTLAMSKRINDRKSVKNLLEKGFKRAINFDSNSAAQKTLSFYKSL